MNISDKLTEQKLLEIMVASYTKGHEKESIQITEMLEEIKQQVLSVVNSN